MRQNCSDATAQQLLNIMLPDIAQLISESANKLQQKFHSQYKQLKLQLLSTFQKQQQKMATKYQLGQKKFEIINQQHLRQFHIVRRSINTLKTDIQQIEDTKREIKSIRRQINALHFSSSSIRQKNKEIINVEIKKQIEQKKVQFMPIQKQDNSIVDASSVSYSLFKITEDNIIEKLCNGELQLLGRIPIRTKKTNKFTILKNTSPCIRFGLIDPCWLTDQNSWTSNRYQCIIYSGQWGEIYEGGQYKKGNLRKITQGSVIQMDITFNMVTWKIQGQTISHYSKIVKNNWVPFVIMNKKGDKIIWE